MERQWQLDERERILKEKEKRSRSRSKSPVNDTDSNYSNKSVYKCGFSNKRRDQKKPKFVLPPSKRTAPAPTHEESTPQVQCLDGVDLSRNKSPCIQFVLKV